MRNESFASKAGEEWAKQVAGTTQPPERFIRRDGADLDELRAALKERRVALLAKGIREQPKLYGR